MSDGNAQDQAQAASMANLESALDKLALEEPASLERMEFVAHFLANIVESTINQISAILSSTDGRPAAPKILLALVRDLVRYWERMNLPNQRGMVIESFERMKSRLWQMSRKVVVEAYEVLKDCGDNELHTLDLSVFY